VLAPVVRGRKGEYEALLDDLAKQGFVRARVDGEVVELSERAPSPWPATSSTPSRWWWTGWCGATTSASA
jgi:excinuclease UvrABC ATPase subunit